MRKKRILIAEAEEVVAKEIESSLQSLGYEVTSIVDSGDKAIKLAETERPELILLDISIQGDKDGIEIADFINSTCNIPVIFLATRLDEDKAKNARPTLPFGYIIKPIQGNYLGVTIEMALYVLQVEIKRREAEASLIKSETRFRELFNGMSDGVAVYECINEGEDFIFLDFNKAAEKIENIRKEDIIGKSVVEFFPGVKEFGIFEVFQRVWRTGISEDHPTALYKDQKITVWRENHVYKLPSGEVVAIYRDVTGKKQFDEKLENTKKRLELILNTVQSGVVIIDKETRTIVEANPAALQMIEAKPADIIGKTCHQFICPTIKGGCPILDSDLKEDNSEQILIKKDGSKANI